MFSWKDYKEQLVTLKSNQLPKTDNAANKDKDILKDLEKQGKIDKP